MTALDPRPSRPIWDALSWRSGSVRLIGLRLIVLVLASVPAFFATRAGLASSVGRATEIANQEGAQSFAVIATTLRALPDSFYAAAVIGLLSFFVFAQVLNAAALHLLAPSPGARETRVWATLWQEGWLHFWPFVRVAALAGLLNILGVIVLVLLHRWLSRHGEAAGWLGITRVLTQPGLEIVAGWLWFSCVGTLSFWCRVLIVADGRRRLRRTFFHVLRLLFRAPLRGGLFFVVVAVTVQVAGGVLLAAFVPRGHGVSGVLPWAVYLVVQAWVWHWLLRVGRIFYAQERFDIIRRRSDDPFGLSLRRARDLIVERLGRAAAH